MHPSIQKYNLIKNRYREHIIIHPIMTGGILPHQVQQRLVEEGWLKVGYSACFDCIEGRSSLVSNPPIRDFLSDVAEMLGGDVAEHTLGCRAAQFAVMKAIHDHLRGEGSREHERIVIADSLCHYTTAIAAEMLDLKLVEVPHTGYPEYRITAQGYEHKIQEVKESTGKLPGLIVATHADPYYGNLSPVEEIGKLAQEYGIPYMVNAAYTAGIMKISAKQFRADFLTVSAHKSMASLGPLGFLVTNYEWAKKVFKQSTISPEWSGRIFGAKIPSLIGCSVGGIPLISAMYSFPYVVDRLDRWDQELQKIHWFIQQMEDLDGIMLIGERPHRHHLMHFETPRFWEISKHHKRKGFFLVEEMLRRGIVGLHRGMSKHIKLSVYGLSWDQLKKVRDAFYEIAESSTRSD